MASLTPLLCSTPGTPPTYNVGMAETFSWVPVEGAGRPLFARAGYITNLKDLNVSLSAGSLSVAGVSAVTVLNPVTSVSITNPTSAVTILNPVSSVTISTPVTAVVDAKQIETLLTKLTAQQITQTDNQDEIITLLNAITATAIEVDLNTDQLELHVDGVEGKQDLTNTMLAAMTANMGTVPGFNIPPYTEIQFQYVGATDIFRQVTYFNNSTQVLSLSFTYVTEPPTVGNAIIQSVKKV